MQVTTRNEVLNVHENFCMFNAFISKHEPKIVKTALEHPDWVVVMKSELTEFGRNKVWRIIPKPNNVSIVFLNGCLKTKLLKKVMWFAMNQDSSLKVILNKKGLITMNPLLYRKT